MDINGFQLYLIRKGLKPRGIEYYINNLKRLSKLSDLSVDSINAFILDQVNKGLSASYINDYIASIKAYGKYQEIDFRWLKFLKERSKPKATMSMEEIRAFLELPPLLPAERECQTERFTNTSLR